jgi:TonB family protein
MQPKESARISSEWQLARANGNSWSRTHAEIRLWPCRATLPHPVAIVTSGEMPHITFVMLELRQNPVASTSRMRPSQSRQPRRLLLALTLVLTALVAVVIRDRDFWFGSDTSTVDTDSAPVAVQSTPVKAAPASVAQLPATTTLPVPSAKKTTVIANATAAKSVAQPTVQKQIETPAPQDAPAVVTNRTAVAPLDVEIVAGDNHRVVRPGTGNATKVEIPKSGSSFGFSQPAFAAVTNAADRERVSTGIETAPGTYEANYPLLSQHMNVQGSVVMQALIGADGVIENLHVLSGPAILTSAAQQAVREWHFKPYMLNGQPVETKARITVNFTIKIADNSANIS